MKPPEISAALLAALAELGPRVAPERIDQVWLFPPRRLGTAESSLAVFSLYAADGPHRREVATLHCTATPQKRGIRRADQWVEQGSAPADRVERVIRGVLARLKDERELPHSEQILGSPERWHALLHGLASAA